MLCDTLYLFLWSNKSFMIVSRCHMIPVAHLKQTIPRFTMPEHVIWYTSAFFISLSGSSLCSSKLWGRLIIVMDEGWKSKIQEDTSEPNCMKTTDKEGSNGTSTFSSENVKSWMFHFSLNPDRVLGSPWKKIDKYMRKKLEFYKNKVLLWNGKSPSFTRK